MPWSGPTSEVPFPSGAPIGSPSPARPPGVRESAEGRELLHTGTSWTWPPTVCPAARSQRRAGTLSLSHGCCALTVTRTAHLSQESSDEGTLPTSDIPTDAQDLPLPEKQKRDLVIFPVLTGFGDQKVTSEPHRWDQGVTAGSRRWQVQPHTPAQIAAWRRQEPSLKQVLPCACAA